MKWWKVDTDMDAMQAERDRLRGTLFNLVSALQASPVWPDLSSTPEVIEALDRLAPGGER